MVRKTKCALCGKRMTVCDECKVREAGLKLISYKEYNTLCDEITNYRIRLRMQMLKDK